MELRRRYQSLYIPSDFFNAVFTWVDAFPLTRPFQFSNACNFHILHKEVDPLAKNTAVLDPPDANHTYSAKVWLSTINTLCQCVSCYEDAVDSQKSLKVTWNKKRKPKKLLFPAVITAPVISKWRASILWIRHALWVCPCLEGSTLQMENVEKCIYSGLFIGHGSCVYASIVNKIDCVETIYISGWETAGTESLQTAA